MPMFIFVDFINNFLNFISSFLARLFCLYPHYH